MLVSIMHCSALSLQSLVAPRTVTPRAEPTMALPIDLAGKVAFVAGVGDSSGYGWAVVKSLTEAGATVTVGTWPPVLKIFQQSLKSGKFDDGSMPSADTHGQWALPPPGRTLT